MFTSCSDQQSANAPNYKRYNKDKQGIGKTAGILCRFWQMRLVESLKKERLFLHLQSSDFKRFEGGYISLGRKLRLEFNLCKLA